MKICVLGDTHGNLRHVKHVVEQAYVNECDLIFQVGDWGFTWPGYQEKDELQRLQTFLEHFDMPMLWIDGNHDNFPDLKERGFWGANKMCTFDDANLIQYVPRGHVWEWDGKVCMAMGGAWSVDQDKRTPGTSWWADEVISESDILQAQFNLDSRNLLGKVDLFFSHDAPADVPRLEESLQLTERDWAINPRHFEGSRSNREALWRIVEQAKPKTLIHGHYHWSYTGTKEWDGHKMRVAGLACDGMKESYTIVECKTEPEICED